ncbi:MAG: hypothetical protein ABIN61_00995 [candidate division WOR-3 bacterium]
MKEFECKGCGNFIWIPGEKERSPVCSECRSVMEFVENVKNSSYQEKIICPECNEIFFVKKGKLPYKCVFCNYTFSVSPGLKQKERL